MNEYSKDPHIEKPDISGEKTELSTHEISRIIFWSFYFSQGSIDIQKDIFKYLAIEHPQWNAYLSADDRAEVMRYIIESVEQMAQSGKHIPVLPDFAEWQTDAEIDAFVEQLTTTTKTEVTSDDKAKLLDAMTHDMLLSGKRFFSGDTNSSKHRQGAALSFVCEYGLLGTKTALPEFDALFKEIAVRMHQNNNSGGYNEETLALLHDVVAAHNAAHPERQIML